MKVKKDLNYFAEKSLKHKGENKYYPCDIALKVDGHRLKAHEVSVCGRDLLFFCDKGTVSFVVDTYGDRHVIEMLDWELDIDDQSNEAV